MPEKYDSDNLFSEDHVVFSYTTEDAERSGILFNILNLWDSLISQVTTSLLSHGYI